jgi:hypothetical protein
MARKSTTSSAARKTKASDQSTINELTARSLKELRRQLTVLEQGGPISALMAEYPDSPRGNETAPACGGFLKATLVEWSFYLGPDGRQMVREMWANADDHQIQKFKEISKDASLVALRLIRNAGFEVAKYAEDLYCAWLWSLFEIAELKPTGTALRLADDCFIAVAPKDHAAVLQAMSEMSDYDKRRVAFLVDEPGPTVYWELSDVIAASIAVIQLAEVQLERDQAEAVTKRTPTKKREPKLMRLARAIQQLQKNPSQKPADVSRATGIPATWFTVNKEEYEEAAKKIIQAAAGKIRPGTKDAKTGEVVSADDPRTCDRLVGEPAGNGGLVWGKCRGCDEWIKVNKSDLLAGVECKSCE